VYTLTGELTQQNAATVVAAGLAALAAGLTEFDLSGLNKVDSSAVATLLAWQREAVSQQKTLNFHAIPASLVSLISLYGLNTQFPSAASGRH